MTRLTTEDLRKIPNDLEAYDRELEAVTGLGLLDLALKTTEITIDGFKQISSRLRSVAVVPMTTGQGMIPGFSEQIEKIGRYLGLPCLVTKLQDLAGIGEAVGGGAEILFFADDDTFLALHLVSRKIIDNAVATGEIYAVALTEACGDACDDPAGILGLGPVGCAAANWLDSHGFQVIVNDRNADIQSEYLAAHPRAIGAKDVYDILGRTRLILDATPATDMIKICDVEDHLVLAAPGIPLGVDDPASEKLTLIHDPLQLGVAAMMVQVLV
jgi:pyrrolysine biosynthesis protein PylD